MSKPLKLNLDVLNKKLFAAGSDYANNTTAGSESLDKTQYCHLYLQFNTCAIV